MFYWIGELSDNYHRFDCGFNDQVRLVGSFFLSPIVSFAAER